MSQLITGIHHVTAIASGAQGNVEFYTGILGLRMVKKTVNFDAPEVYHFYYGGDLSEPGSILTFFPYDGLIGGRHGKGMLNTTAFSVSQDSISFWTDRFKKYGIAFKQPVERFGTETVIYFEDQDGTGLELVFNSIDKRAGYSNGIIPAEHGIKGFYNVEIWEEGYERTAGLLTEQLDHTFIAENSNRFRFAANNKPGHFVDIICSPDSLKGLSGSGTVHHLAFLTPDRESQDEVRIKIARRMLNPTPVRERNYFTSIYFREPGGVLFEVATAGPGFLIDETAEHTGSSLMLPHQFEKDRSRLENILPVIHSDLRKYT